MKACGLTLGLVCMVLCDCQLLIDLQQHMPLRIVAHQPDQAAPTTVGEISIRFSAPTPRPLAERAFTLIAGEDVIEGHYRWHHNDTTLLFRPVSALPRNRSLVMRVGRTVEDVWGNSLESDFEFGFRIVAPMARIISVIPQDGMTVNELRPTIVLRFSASVTSASLYHAFSIEPAVPGRFRWLEDQHVVRFEPLRDLQADVDYRLRLSEELQTIDGGRVDTTLDSLFRVTAPRMAQVARVVSVATDGEREIRPTGDVAVNDIELGTAANLRVEFSAPVAIGRRPDLISITPRIDLRYTWLRDYSVCLLRPAVQLENGARYQLQIGEERYRIVVNSPRLQTPQVEGVWFIADTTATPIVRTRLLQGANIDLPAGDMAALEFRLSHAAGAAIGLVSFATSFSLTSEGSLFGFAIRDIQVVERLSGRHTLRLPLTISESGTPPDIVSLQLDTTLGDSFGNRLSAPFRLEFNGY